MDAARTNRATFGSKPRAVTVWMDLGDNRSVYERRLVGRECDAPPPEAWEEDATANATSAMIAIRRIMINREWLFVSLNLDFLLKAPMRKNRHRESLLELARRQKRGV